MGQTHGLRLRPRALRRLTRPVASPRDQRIPPRPRALRVALSPARSVMAIYGIDLGTTFSSVAYVARGVSQVIPLELGRPTLASLCLFTTPHGAPTALVGTPALDAYRTLVGDAAEPPPGVVLVRGAKNHIGVREATYAGPPWRVADHDLYATDVSAVFLRTLAEMVRGAPGLPPLDGVVVTHPQRFRNREKLATAQAARLAGLPLLGMLTEPDAAAWAYGLHGNTDKPGQTFMVFDFGGGTLDVTLMRREPSARGAAQVRAIDSYGVQLGGLSLDRTIRDALVAQYAAATGDPAFSLATVSEATAERLLELAEWFKITLNTDAGADSNPLARERRKRFTPVFDAEAEGEEVTLRLTLGDLGRILSGEIDRAVGCADEALARARLRWDQLDEVLLTGGSSLLWPLQQRLRERCGAVRVFDDPAHPLNPLTIVASGAALYGASLAEGGAGRVGVEVRGVVPDTFGIQYFVPDPRGPDGRRAEMYPLVPAGTPTPFVGRASFTMRGGGQVLPVEVFEGRTLAEATRVGVYQVDFGREVPDGSTVEVTLDVQGGGVLVLGVRDARSGVMREARLDDAPGLYSDAEMASRAAWLQALRVDWRG